MTVSGFSSVRNTSSISLTKFPSSPNLCIEHRAGTDPPRWRAGVTFLFFGKSARSALRQSTELPRPQQEEDEESQEDKHRASAVRGFWLLFDDMEGIGDSIATRHMDGPWLWRRVNVSGLGAAARVIAYR